MEKFPTEICLPITLMDSAKLPVHGLRIIITVYQLVLFTALVKRTAGIVRQSNKHYKLQTAFVFFSLVYFVALAAKIIVYMSLVRQQNDSRQFAGVGFVHFEAILQ